MTKMKVFYSQIFQYINFNMSFFLVFSSTIPSSDASLSSLSPSSSLLTAASSSVSIAPLADVGIGPFLIKNGRQFLRLNLPTISSSSSDSSLKLGPASYADEGRKAQEALELVRLRFEQVGFTNPAAWAGPLPSFFLSFFLSFSLSFFFSFSSSLYISCFFLLFSFPFMFFF